MKSFLILFCFLISSIGFTQIMGEDEVYLKGQLIEPEFSEGYDGFYQLFYAKIKDKNVKKGEIVKVSFVVSQEGKRTKLKIVRFDDMDTAMIVMETLKEINDTDFFWKPASRMGKYVAITVEMPFKF